MKTALLVYLIFNALFALICFILCWPMSQQMRGMMKKAGLGLLIVLGLTFATEAYFFFHVYNILHY